MDGHWGERLTRAGLVVEGDRAVVVDLAPPMAAERLETTDRQALDALLVGGVGDVRRRSDLRIVTERRLWIARGPAASMRRHATTCNPIWNWDLARAHP